MHACMHAGHALAPLITLSKSSTTQKQQHKTLRKQQIIMDKLHEVCFLYNFPAGLLTEIMYLKSHNLTLLPERKAWVSKMYESH